MSEERHTQTGSQRAATQLSGGAGLPPHIARLVNPDVRQRRLEMIEDELADAERAQRRRERYLSTLVDHHVWPALKSG